MDHTEAIRSKAAERYLLGELKGDERNQYEEHFFGCSECALDIKAGATFMDNTRDALASDKAFVPSTVSKPHPQNWFTLFLRPAFAAPALALLLLVVAYQSGIVIPRLNTGLAKATAPQALPSFSLITANSRGGSPLTIHVPENKPFSIFLDIPPATQFPYYNCELQSESGAPEFSVNVSSADAREPIQLLIPASRLQAGKHVVIVRGSGSPDGTGAAKTEVARYSFSLEFAK
jgi:Putative zinc-finger